MVKTGLDDRDYVLGTGDPEIERLFLQHDVWRSRSRRAWQQARFEPGETILDLGCGPGAASLDLAQLVGSSGRVIAVDQSARFLSHLSSLSMAYNLSNVVTFEADLSSDDLSFPAVDHAWLRWILAFVPQPRGLLERTCAALRPGGTIVVHEYFAYETWKLIPEDTAFTAFVQAVIASWRSRGGEPNVGGNVPGWLEDLGLTVVGTKPAVDVVTAADRTWLWPTTFAASGLTRLRELGDISAQDEEQMRASIERLTSEGTRMVTPAVLEVIAEKKPT